MQRLRTLVAGLLAVGAVVVTGCATPQDVEKLRADLLTQMTQNDRAQQDRLQALQDRLKKAESNDEAVLGRFQSLEKRVEQVAQIPSELEAAVRAVNAYARDVEKSIHSLRELTARELDRQNTHIRKVKSSYKSVLDQEIQAVTSMSKTLDAVMADLKATLENSTKVLGEAIPSTEETIPPAPTLPKGLKIEGGTGAPPPPPPPPPPKE